MNYHDRPEMSQSKMKVLLDSPRMFYRQYILKDKIDNKTKSKQFGTCLDLALTEPEIYATFIVKNCKETTVPNCTTKVWDLQIKQIIQDLNNYRINDTFFEGAFVNTIISSCKKQVETYYEYHDIDWRMKTDYECINDESSFFIDIKSTCATTYDEFIKDFFKYKYYLQAASYSQGLKIKHNLNIFPLAYFIGISTTTGEIFAIRCSDELIDLGLQEIEHGCKLYHYMLKTGEWCKNADLKILDAPYWIRNEIITLGETL